MLKRIIITAVALSFVNAGCTSQEPFVFVHMSDPQIGFIDNSPRYAHSDSLMKAAVEASNALDPAYVFITGDLLNEPYNAVQDSIYRTRKAELKAPVYEVPGNHDIMGYTPEKRQHYLDWRGYDHFSFRERGCAFIGLDSNCIKDANQEAEARQLVWLQQELKSAAGSRYIFVFLHCPIIRETLDEKEDYFNFSMEKRRQYLTLFKEAGVSAVFAGHCHQDYVAEYEGMGLYTAGPVGNALGRGYPGYNVVRVSEEGFSVEYVSTF